MDIPLNAYRILEHNPAESEKKEQYIHNGKGTATIIKKGIRCTKA